MKTSFTEALTVEIGKLLHPLTTLSTAEEIQTLLGKLGYDVPLSDAGTVVTDFQGLIQDVQAVLTEVAKLPGATTQEQKITILKEIGVKIGVVTPKIKSLVDKVKTTVNAVKNAPDKDKLPRRLGDYLVYTYLEEYYPAAFAANHFLGLAEETEITIGNTTKKIKTIQWKRVSKAFSKPVDIFDEVYNWSINFAATQPEDYANKFLARFEKLVVACGVPGGIYTQASQVSTNLGRPGGSKEVRIPLYQDGEQPDNWRELTLNLSPIPAAGNSKAGLLLYPYFFGGVTFEDDINANWTFELDGDTNLGSGLGVGLRPVVEPYLKKDLFSASSNPASVDVKVYVKRKDTGDQIVLIGNPDHTNLSLGSIGFYAFFKKEANKNELDAGLEMTLKELRFELRRGDGDGFLNKIIPENGFAAQADLIAGYSVARGFYFKGSPTFEIYLPLHLNLGPLKFEGLTLGFTPQEGKFGLSMGSTVMWDKGPFFAMIENMGLKVDLNLPKDGDTDFSLSDIKVGFKPPNGIALSIETAAVTGGGYLGFYPEKKEYFGVAELSIKDKIALKAIGILNTELPGGEKGYSLLLIITAEFTPINLAMGFTLNGVGGLIGMHRTIDVEALRAGVKTKAYDHLLFPDDPVKNAKAIIADLKAIFPVAKDRYTFGIMARIGWGTPTLITIDLGLIIEVPNPVKLAILGVIKCILPDEKNPRIKLQCNFLGLIEFEKKRLSFDASIFDSKIISITLEGDMALRVSWGSQSSFLLSVGGFHPSFQAPAGLTNMKRLTVNLLGGDNPRVTLTAYFAITSNTVQFGSRVDLFAKISNKLTAQGYMGFDALFRFNPFYFNLSAYAYLSLKWNGSEKMTLSLSIVFEGPTPYKVQGDGEVKVMGIKFNVSLTRTWGESDSTTLLDADVAIELQKVLNELRNWNSVLPDGTRAPIVLRKLEKMDGLLHPPGDLRVSQTTLPLGINIECFGNQRAANGGVHRITGVKVGGTALTTSAARENFAPAQFRRMSDTEKISSASFVQFDSGVAARIDGVGFAGENSTMVQRQRPVEHELIVLGAEADNAKLGMDQKVVAAAVKNGPSGKTPYSAAVVSKSPLAPKMIGIKQEKYAVAYVSTLKAYDPDDPLDPLDPTSIRSSFVEATDYYRDLIQQHPELKTQLLIVPATELVP